MENKAIEELFCLAQHGKAKHKKYLNKLHNIFQKEDLQNYVKEYMRLLLHAFDAEISNIPAKSVLEFASSFCVEIVTDHEKRMREADEGDDSEHPFFVCLIEEILQYVSLKKFNVRFHACQFLGLLFGKFGADIGISDMICDNIQRALIERTLDLKPQVRSQAIKVLLRLQNTQDGNCPVIESFLESIIDPIPTVRKLVVESIAPCQATFSSIIARLRDVDAGVRTATFTKLSKITPKALTIVYRQFIVMSGVKETNGAPKRAFEDVLLPKWLKAYDSNIIKLMDALKLDAHNEDIIQTEMIYKNILPIIFKTVTLQELLELLNLDDDKLVPVIDLSIEKVNYWSYLIHYIKQLDDAELEDIIPVLTKFVTYINSFIKLKSQETFRYWEQLEYQQILRKLFEILLEMDVSDEFGREEMQKLIVSVLTNVKLEKDVIGIIIKAFHTIINDVEQLTYELCSIMVDIKDPLEEVEQPPQIRLNQEIQIAQLKVKLHVINDDMKKAVQDQEYSLVDELNKAAENIKNQVKQLEEKFKENQTVVVRKPRNDMETMCRCLDIISALMENIHFEKLPTPLIAYKREVIGNEQMDARYPGIYEKIFRVTCLFAIWDKDFAHSSIETICKTIISYKVSNSYDKNVLKTAVGAISDIIRVHGPDLFNNFSTENVEKIQNVSIKKRRGNDRTLYSETIDDSEVEVAPIVNIESITLGMLMDIMLDMLDDTTPDIREYATVALTKLVVRGLCVNSSLLTRLLLKWFNPGLSSDEKFDQKIQQYIGIAVSTYIRDIQNSPAVLEKTILSTMSSIGNAPKTSPLSEVDYDDVLQCLIKFTRIRESATLDTHKHLAYSILNKIINIYEPSVRILSKMLFYLDVPIDEPNVVKELSHEVNIAIDNVTDKPSVKYLKKYFNKLNGIVSEVDETANTLDGTNTTKHSTLSDINHKRRRSTNVSENEDIESLPSTSEVEDQTPAKRRNRACSGEGKSLTTPAKIQNGKQKGEVEDQTPAKRRNRACSGEGKSLTTPAKIQNGKQKDGTNTQMTPAKTRKQCSGETALGTPVRAHNGSAGEIMSTRSARGSTRKTRQTNLEAIEERHEELVLNAEVSKKQASDLNNSDNSNDSVFDKEDEEQTHDNKLTASVKRKKVRGRTANSQTDEDSVNTILADQESMSERRRRGTATNDKKKSLNSDQNTLYTPSSSDLEEIEVSKVPQKRKSQRKL